MSTDSIDQILTRIERRIAIRRGLGVVGVAVAALVVYFGTGFLGTRPVPEIVRFAQFDFFFAEFVKYAQPTFVDLTFYTQENEIGGLGAILATLARPMTVVDTVGSLRSSLIVSAVVMTLAIGIVGTILGFPFALFFGVFGSERVTPFPFNFLFRGVMSTIRAIPALVWVFIYAALVPLSPLTAMLAVATDTVGNLGRLFTDELEEIEEGPIEAVSSTGASRLQVINFGMLSQVSTSFVAWTLYILEINTRIAISLGVVGAGGLGQYIQQNLNLFNSYRAGAGLVTLLALVLSIELLSSRLRARLRPSEHDSKSFLDSLRDLTDSSKWLGTSTDR
ncbi:phosphate/phosphonate ABC transporter permease [Halobellus sp. Atlit-38R]|uniref:PhnE/PtxC family ABC transporter permease n=1 Tax=Halobellus sp. Atlit-38R TaxID=2282131 RepID=UPI000EF1D949|nr:phosphate/phosphonate ABC transporter permease [Halobellus sp. Atlit-38R]RLM90311.1 phosphate/phosphonate ABC transporter permease [Halobellus sp. Atlit-38R]